jgi:EAL domain-containing protein (putative c-di-GMP-specific phosphodiesterase class I)
MAGETSRGTGFITARSAGRIKFIRMIESLAAASPGAADMRLLCVVIDLGDLHRSDRVARTLGPGYTDGIVNDARARIRKAVGAGTKVMQVDTDCFAFARHIDEGDGWQSLVERLVGHLRPPLDCDGLPGAVAPAVGVVRFRAGDAPPDEILQAAMAAAQDAREVDVPWRLYDGASAGTGRRMHALLAALPSALSASDQLSLVYQPRIDLRSGVCTSAEALLRWSHPTLGPVPPGEFIPVADLTGMARFVTAWVVEHALQDLAAWTAAGFDHGVSINISALDLVEENFAGRLGDAIRQHGVDPSRVELEFTEGALVRNSAPVRATTAALATLGVSIAIDDFGTGYSNLQYLRDIPAAVLKIDQSFIRALAKNRRDAIIVRSMIELAHRLGYRVTAEGVEDGAALVMLAAWGCDEGQGYHISRPVPVEAMQAWLAARTAAKSEDPP